MISDTEDFGATAWINDSADTFAASNKDSGHRLPNEATATLIPCAFVRSALTLGKDTGVRDLVLLRDVIREGILCHWNVPPNFKTALLLAEI